MGSEAMAVWSRGATEEKSRTGRSWSEGLEEGQGLALRLSKEYIGLARAGAVEVEALRGLMVQSLVLEISRSQVAGGKSLLEALKLLIVLQGVRGANPKRAAGGSGEAAPELDPAVVAELMRSAGKEDE